jgi:ABC-type transport system involved in Fe-S cluster assembly fused permease/ATPase subunit
MSVLKLSLLAYFQHKVGEISYLLSFNHYFIKYFKLVYRQNVVMVTLITVIMFLLFTCMHFSVRGILRKWSATAESSRHAALQTPLPQHDYKNH